ncbi:SRPBCC domain-containing protein [Micromonospora endolithica]|uniref:SRPBCC domain-containing protein n=1 Tax=Micromonospora endolithica TaxID=230091 RepID=A0A3A9YQV5_9ACTN|nr:SRPBCC domain-containing protein [Micromonospora endolithica]RKN38269.1 SRPBCC domain-containing protein [Micromonospora endolithica]
MSAAITTTIDIVASPQAVWEVLTDFAAYPDWNPFMRRVEGTPRVGTKLVVHLSPPGGRGMRFKPTVLVANPGQELRWLGKLGFSGLFDGEHSFVLTANADGTTHLTHSERFSGILVTLLKGTLKNTRAGFDAFNQALKQRVETADFPR